MRSRLTVVPPPTPGWYVGQYEHQPGDIATFEETIGRKTSHWSAEQHKVMPFDPVGFDVALAEKVWQDGRPIHAHVWETTPGDLPHPIDGVQNPHPPGYTVDRMLRGEYDAKLAELAAGFRAFGRPMFFESIREATGILWRKMGGWGPDGDKGTEWAMKERAAFGQFDVSGLPNAELYADLAERSDIPDGIKRLVAGHRYYVHFFTEKEGIDYFTYHTNGWGPTILADKVATFDDDYAKSVAEKAWDFRSSYAGDDYVDWITMTCHMIRFEGVKWLPNDGDPPNEWYWALLDETLAQVREVAAGKPVMLIETGFADGLNQDSARAAEMVRDFMAKIVEYPEIRAFSFWSDDPQWWSLWPADSLLRPGSQQGNALREIIERDPSLWHSTMHLSDGTTFPVVG